MNSLKQLTFHRRELHKIPELDRDLPKTKTYIKTILNTLDCKVFDVAGGICAYFDRSSENTTAFRADMDALPIKEINSHDFVSIHEGNMHACGHDGHMAMVLSLAQYVDREKKLPCNVLCIFQPSEETTGGAKNICETGVLKKYNVTKIFGIHLWPFLDFGQIGSKTGPIMAKSSEVNIEIFGKASHATKPENGIDALLICCEYIHKVYEAKANIDYLNDSADESTIIRFGRMESGTARNVISNHSLLQGTIRAFSEEKFMSMIRILKCTASDFSEKTNCRITFDYNDGYPPVINNDELYKKVLPEIKKNLKYTELDVPAMTSDDYSFYGLHVPSVFFFLGTGTNIDLHSNNFDFDESILVQGLELYKILLHTH